jgi:hypothetical protein
MKKQTEVMMMCAAVETTIGRLIIVTLMISFAIASEELVVKRSEDSDSLLARITISEFDAKSHNMSLVNDNIIDGEYSYGIDGSFPRYQIDSIRIEDRRFIYRIPLEFFRNCYNPSFQFTSYTIQRSSLDGVMLSMSGSDGAGSYFVIWLLEWNSINRIIDTGVISSKTVQYRHEIIEIK